MSRPPSWRLGGGEARGRRSTTSQLSGTRPALAMEDMGLTVNGQRPLVWWPDGSYQLGFTRPNGLAAVCARSLLTRSKEKWCIIHFFHPDFPRCRIMDKKLDVSTSESSESRPPLVSPPNLSCTAHLASLADTSRS